MKIDDYPSVFWHWNDRLEKRKIIAEVKRLHAWGIRSFLIHPMPDNFRKEDFIEGMTTSYLSPAFFEAVRVAVEQASVLEMQVWIYDEGGWPSAQAGGQLLKRWPYLRAQVMTPHGLVTTSPARTDLLNPETTQRFITITHERYKTAVGEFFGTVIPGVFTDEPDVPGQVGTPRIPWTKDIEEEFEKRTGLSLTPLLPQLFGHGRSDAAREVRIRFVQVWTSLFAERFFDPIRNFCHRHSLALTGHFLGDQSLRGHARCSGHFFKLMQHLDEPGIDTVWGQIDGQRPRSFFPSFASSLLKRSRQRCWSESFAAYGFGLTIQEMKRIADIQLVQGVNKFAPMLLLLSRRGARWVQIASRPLDYAPDAAYYPDLNLYLATTGKRIREGQLFRPVHAPYPIRKLWAEYGRSASTPFNRLTRQLSDRNIGFVFDPEAEEYNMDALERKFWNAWPFSEKVKSSVGIRWIAFTIRKEGFLFCTNTNNRSGKISLQPSNISWTLASGESRFFSLDKPVPDSIFKPVLHLRNWKISPSCQWLLKDGMPTPVKIRNAAWIPCSAGAWTQTLGNNFSGSAIYRTSFAWQDGSDAVLDLGKVSFAAECFVNGQSAGRSAWAPFRFQIGKFLHPGNNTIELHIDGSLANLMRDPATQNELKKRGLWNVYMERTSGLEAKRMNSGLYGPVKILVPKRM